MWHGGSLVAACRNLFPDQGLNLVRVVSWVVVHQEVQGGDHSYSHMGDEILRIRLIKKLALGRTARIAGTGIGQHPELSLSHHSLNSLKGI